MWNSMVQKVFLLQALVCLVLSVQAMVDKRQFTSVFLSLAHTQSMFTLLAVILTTGRGVTLQ